MLLSEYDRFWEKVYMGGPLIPGHEELGPCYLWTAGCFGSGHGAFTLSNPKRQIGAHRWAWLYYVGLVPVGLELDHVCHSLTVGCLGGNCFHRTCVNVAHLEAVTHRINTIRGNTLTGINAAKLYCPQGHEFNLVNTHFRPDGSRKCRALCARRDAAQ